MQKYFLLLLLPTLLFSCKDTIEKNVPTSETAVADTQKIAQLKWLLGTWVNQDGDAYSQETWSMENDSTFTAYSFVEMNKKEIVFAETMALEKKGEDLVLTVASASEDGARPVSFNMISIDSGRVIFENRNHDFPQRIVYTYPAKDSLHAWIEGLEDGTSKKVDFSFNRKE